MKKCLKRAVSSSLGSYSLNNKRNPTQMKAELFIWNFFISSLRETEEYFYVYTTYSVTNDFSLA